MVITGLGLLVHGRGKVRETKVGFKVTCIFYVILQHMPSPNIFMALASASIFIPVPGIII